MLSVVFLVTGCTGFIAAPAPRIFQARHSLLTRVPPPALLPMVLPPTVTRMSGAADDEMELVREDADAIFTVIDFNGDDRIEYAELHAHLRGACVQVMLRSYFRYSIILILGSSPALFLYPESNLVA